MFTKLELEFIDYFKETEYCVGGGYVFHNEWNMKQTRGVMSSLKQKKIITVIDDSLSEPDYPCTWISIDIPKLVEMKILSEDYLKTW
jgi:dephospho-CoA kinase|tara:strand:- start:54 stop:314 length:261 start_codon:yes stop_codon:yes gene_type:complete